MEEAIQEILKNDEATYLNVVKVNAYLDGIAFPTLTAAELDAIDLLTQTANSYNARQEWLRENTTGWEEYIDTSKGDWIGQPYGIGAIPLIYIAIASVVGLIIGAGLVYSLTTATEEAALDRITSSEAWADLCAANPERCEELEIIIEDQLAKVKNRGKFEGMGGSFMIWIGVAVAGITWYKSNKK